MNKTAKKFLWMVMKGFMSKIITNCCYVHYCTEMNYESDQPPRFADEDGEVIKEKPLPVFLNVELLAFDEISTVKMMFSVIMELNITWKDRRLDYLHLSEDPFQNTVSPKYRKTLWIPEIGNFIGISKS